VLLRFYSCYQTAKKFNAKRKTREIADVFISANQAWFLEIGIAIGNYATLRNVLVAGRRERAARRRRNWGFVTNISGQRFLSTNAAYVRHVQAGGRGLA
jgi:hypothetical protein